MSRIFSHIFTPWRLKWYPRFLVTAWAVGVLFSILTTDGVSTLTGRLGADYPAFYGAARIVAEGDGRNLYDSERQMAAQRDLFPANEKGFMPFPYPPFVALAYVPLGHLGYRLSYTIHTMFMVGALLLALWMLRPMSRIVKDQFFLTFAIVLLYYPMMRTILGGSNTALTLLLLVSAWRTLNKGRPLLAGVFLGLLLFKPQYALPVIGLFLLSRRWTAVIASAVTGAVLWAISALVSGWGWGSGWFEYGRWVIGIAADIDKSNAVSWLGFFEALWGTGAISALVAGYSLAAVTILIACAAWWQRPGRGDPASQMALAAACILLIPAHAFYYDAGILVITWLVVLGQDWKYKAETVAAIWIWGFTQIFADRLGFSPIFFFTACTFAVAVWRLFPRARSAGKISAFKSEPII